MREEREGPTTMTRNKKQDKTRQRQEKKKVNDKKVKRKNDEAEECERSSL
jgi:hypothetical protein